jgi:tetratricopeptide (TPR) repeat protein
MVKIWNATEVSPDRVYRRMAYDWVKANISDASGVEDEQAQENPPNLPEPARTFAIQMAQNRTEQLGRIPVYFCRLGDEFRRSNWTVLTRISFTLAENAFQKNTALNPGKASAHGDFAFFLVTCPDPQVRDAAKALTHAQKAVALDPANADFVALLGMAQYRAGQWQAAAETLEKAIEWGPTRYSDHAKIFLSMAHHQLGDATEAHRWHRQTLLTEIKEDGSMEELRLLRAEAAALLGIPGGSSSVPAEGRAERRP